MDVALLNALIGASPPTAVVVYLVIRFLQHMRETENKTAERELARDVTLQSNMEGLVERVEAIAKENRESIKETSSAFTAALGDFRAEARRTTDGLISVHKEAGVTMGSMSSQIQSASSEVKVLSQTVATQGAKIDALSTKVDHLADKIEQHDKPTGEKK